MLQVYHVDDSDWVVAESAEEAIRIGEALYGAPYERYDDEPTPSYPEDDGKVLPIHNFADDGVTVTHTCAEWVALQGRGFLCSENY